LLDQAFHFIVTHIIVVITITKPVMHLKIFFS